MKWWENYKIKFFIVWKDPVWSKIISVGILALIGLVYAKLTNHSWSEIYQFLLKGLNYNLPVYIFLSLFGLYFIVKKSIQIFKRRKHKLHDVQIGNYTFKQLVQIMQLETLKIQTNGMAMNRKPPPQEDILFLFQVYYSSLNKGFGWDDRIEGDGGYLYSILAPRLVGFGLVETYQKQLDDLPDRTEIAYKTSELGHKFHALLEQSQLEFKLKEEKKKQK